ncbi:MAG: tryptophan synthase subunit alpha [Desulfuromonadaceae bacterium]
MGRIEDTFIQLKQQNRAGLIPFITAGDPDIDTTFEIMRTLEQAGADIIELGMPFSDPAADGPTIQAASQRALDAGTSLEDVLTLVERFRSVSDVPVVLMGYYNPIYVYGMERFAARAARAGVDGLLLVDVPFEHRGEIREYLDPHAIRSITLIAPTTMDKRTQELLNQTEGFVYYVSMTGVTGTTSIDTDSIRERVSQIRELSPVPVAVGFGITTGADARQVAEFADAVVVGSALVKVIQRYSGSAELLDQVREFVKDLRRGIEQAQS